MDTNRTISSRVGSIVGLAIGDALGAPVEFQVPGQFEPVTDYRAGGPFNLEAGEWTDDTAMAVNMGNDADTLGAVTGQIAGAIYGVGGIPKDWIDGLAKSKGIQQIANNLATGSGDLVEW